MVSAKCAWEVMAGIILGQVDHKHTRRFSVDSREWENAGDDQLVLLLTRFNAAVAYAAFLQILCANGREVNWVRLEFIWF